MSKRYLICGLPPGLHSGVGRLLLAAESDYRSKGYRIITPRPRKSGRVLLDQWRYHDLAIELLLRPIDRLIFTLRCLSIRNSSAILIHPQTIGYQLVFWLYRTNTISIYVMDNSYFCIRSYNCHPITTSECLHCVANPTPLPECDPYPISISKKVAISILQHLAKISENITFLVQNQKQSDLLRLHFGPSVSTSIVGLPVDTSSSTLCPVSISQAFYPDIVFHGVTSFAKGVNYIVALAELLPSYTFLIPDSPVNICTYLQISSLSPNIYCLPITWETGLQDYIVNAKVVIHPSQWSAPIEGALIKSAKFNRNVATVSTLYGYEAEISEIRNHIRLSPTPQQGALELDNALKDIIQSFKP